MAHSSRKTGSLFIVATPIGNLADISYRAVEALKRVDLIAAEDTRHSRKLLQRYAISTKVVAFHEHNERAQVGNLVESLLGGKDVALITDAGTPLISDPGYRLVRASHRHDISVVPVPGCCAAVAALSVAGLPADRFVFEGFLPAKSAARINTLERLKQESRTLIFYESTHRIKDSLVDLIEVFGGDRPAVVARELTKQYETLLRGSLAQIQKSLNMDADQQKGEFVLLVQGIDSDRRVDAETLRILGILKEALPLKQAAALTAKITGKSKNLIYQMGLERKPK